MMLSTPEATASSTPYWMIGLSTSGSISFGWGLVGGGKRGPRAGTGEEGFGGGGGRQGLDTAAVQDANRLRAQEIKRLGVELDAIEHRRNAALLLLPNLPHSSVPV